ncbi:MAG: phenylalanine--tRNA ligase subunit alpha [Calditrichaeota bacterium]|nr:MAG: phenylalanine--tRNA ligase subunit alpha [Calditrichota bacterium]MBL1204158.1 phenylalanine--tRNA ligase subunit alpha [Calditrichota bacterium]NOG43989.1 phenylalanine--tRNA ligase subunit alpha [Calditrichota bacterium]
MHRIKEIKDSFDAEIEKVNNESSLEELRVKFLGRKGLVTGAFAFIKDVSPADKPKFGAELNICKKQIEQAFSNKKSSFLSDENSNSKIDLTLPGRRTHFGRKHPLIKVADEIKSIFKSFGFSIEDGPEIETDYYNFEALNIPKSHPARAMQDTLYITEDIVLRTHTSPVQIRVMEDRKPPIRIIAPGRVYRRDTPDATHSPFFHQVEGLVVGETVTFADLKGVIQAFAHKMFGKDAKVRFRPSFFPFTEPSAEYDVWFNGKWMEISGCGMVHPNVFKAVNIDPQKYSGYAFGMGIDRVAMLKYDVKDIRLFFENDVRFLNQF